MMQWPIFNNFCRAMLYISAAYAVMRCLSVCLSRSWIMSKRINISSNFFHHRVATPFQFFRTKRGGDIPTGTPLRGRRMQVGQAEIAIQSLYLDSVPAVSAATSQMLSTEQPVEHGQRTASTACCEAFQRQVQYRPRRVITLVAGERPSLLMVGNNDEVYDKQSQRYAEDNVTQW